MFARSSFARRWNLWPWGLWGLVSWTQACVPLGFGTLGYLNYWTCPKKYKFWGILETLILEKWTSGLKVACGLGFQGITGNWGNGDGK